MEKWLKRLEELQREAGRAPLPTSDVPPAAQPTPSDTAALAAQEAAILWRAAAMRPQVPPHGPIGFLHARELPAGAVPPGACPSCGEEMEAGQLYACRACQHAKHLVLAEAREDVDAPAAS